MECAGPKDLFTKLARILKLSTHFKMALSEGILLCFGTLDFYQKCVCVCTIELVPEEVLTAKT
jgi:hypothetical protein